VNDALLSTLTESHRSHSEPKLFSANAGRAFAEQRLAALRRSRIHHSKLFCESSAPRRAKARRCRARRTMVMGPAFQRSKTRAMQRRASRSEVAESPRPYSSRSLHRLFDVCRFFARPSSAVRDAHSRRRRFRRSDVVVVRNEGLEELGVTSPDRDGRRLEANRRRCLWKKPNPRTAARVRTAQSARSWTSTTTTTTPASSFDCAETRRGRRRPSRKEPRGASLRQYPATTLRAQEINDNFLALSYSWREMMQTTQRVPNDAPAAWRDTGNEGQPAARAAEEESRFSCRDARQQRSAAGLLIFDKDNRTKFRWWATAIVRARRSVFSRT